MLQQNQSFYIFKNTWKSFSSFELKTEILLRTVWLAIADLVYQSKLVTGNADQAKKSPQNIIKGTLGKIF